jgi:2-polyprenyl-3-methyl-5-hydroxy-6-metoxy-1,4-benzoquinol methylase
LDAILYDELQQVEHTHWWFRARRQIVWSLVERFINRPRGRRLQVCELGCGTGGNLAAVAEQHDVVGVECSPHALAHARKALGRRIHWGRLPDEVRLPAESFDIVLMTDVLEHIEEDAASAETALGLVRPGGLLIATVPAYQWLYSPRDAQHHHFRRYGKRQFAALWNIAEAETILLSHYNTLLFAPAAAARLVSKALAGRGKIGDIKVPGPLVNSLLTRTMGSEASLLGRVPVPFGLSLICVVRKL